MQLAKENRNDKASPAIEMRAVQYDGYGGPEVLATRSVPLPEMKPGHALVRVEATSINGADVHIRAGDLKLVSGRKFPRGAGFDFAGEVVARADDVTEVAVCDAVWGFLPDVKGPASGAAAEYAMAPVDSMSLRPRSVSAVDAVAIGSTGAAAIGVLRDSVELQPGERVLIRGGAGGVGTAAVQVAKMMGGHITATARAAHLDKVRELGADEVFDYGTTGPRDLGRFDVIVDPVGTELRAYRKLLDRGGRMAEMGAYSPLKILYMLASKIHGKRQVRLVQAPPTHARLKALAADVEAGRVVPVVDSVYPLDRIADAHRSVEAGGGFGKRVVTVG